MTLLAVPRPLPKASVEYAWVQPHKLLLSALKSEVSPSQQMGGGIRKKTYWKRREEGTCLTYLQRWKINQVSHLFRAPAKRVQQEALAQASLLAHTLDCTSVRRLCLLSARAMLLFYLNMEVLGCVYASAFVSVCPYHFAWSPGQLPGNRGRQLSTAGQQTLPHAHGFDKRHRSALIRYQVRVASG